MVLTEKNVIDLNSMNEAARRASLGTIVKELQENGGSGGGATTMATVSKAGVVKKASTQANSTATDIEALVSDFNSLLEKLKTAGIMA